MWTGTLPPINKAVACKRPGPASCAGCPTSRNRLAVHLCSHGFSALPSLAPCPMSMEIIVRACLTGTCVCSIFLGQQLCNSIWVYIGGTCGLSIKETCVLFSVSGRLIRQNKKYAHIQTQALQQLSSWKMFNWSYESSMPCHQRGKALSSVQMDISRGWLEF